MFLVLAAACRVESHFGRVNRCGSGNGEGTANGIGDFSRKMKLGLDMVKWSSALTSIEEDC